MRVEEYFAAFVLVFFYAFEITSYQDFPHKNSLLS